VNQSLIELKIIINLLGGNPGGNASSGGGSPVNSPTILPNKGKIISIN